jgi:glycerol-3-phosphate acyltransferase PlsX
LLKRIAIDVMGGDFGPSVAVPAALRSLALHPDLHLVLVGVKSEIEKFLGTITSTQRDRLDIIHTDICVHDDVKPESVLRRYKDSSMYLAVEMVKDKKVEACVSAGNTGALLLTGRHLLKTIPEIDKPAIIASIPLPMSNQRCYLLDVGANVSSNAQQLVEFAVMGSVLAWSVDDIARPRVGLLNMGREEHKGTEQIRLAAAKLDESATLNYVGFVEGNEIYSNKVDVLVCEGFAGNIAIKTSAGVVGTLKSLLERRIAKNWYTRFLGLLAWPLLAPLAEQVSPSRFNGASVLGLQGIIVKSHGNATSEGFFYAIEQALKEIQDNVPALISQEMSKLLSTSKAT